MIVSLHTASYLSTVKVVYDIIIGIDTIIFIDRSRPPGREKDRWVYKPHMESAYP